MRRVPGAAQRQIRQNHQRGGKRGPGRGRRSVVGKREPAGPDRARAGRQSLLAGRGPVAAQLQTPAGDVGEALRPAGDDFVRRPQGPEGELALRLLPAEPAVAGEPSGKDHGGGVKLRQRGCCADQGASIAIPYLVETVGDDRKYVLGFELEGHGRVPPEKLLSGAIGRRRDR